MKKSFEKRNSKVVRKVAMSCAIAAVMTLYLPVMAFANDPWDIANGDITVNRTSETAQQVSQGGRHEDDPNPTITGTSNNRVDIVAAQGTTATVTFSGLTINTRTDPTDERTGDDAAVTVNGEGNVSIELEGSNSLTSGYYHAGLEDDLTGTLTINDVNNDGSLTAIGGYNGAGIGGGANGTGSNITIAGGSVTATGGQHAAGIGGGDYGAGSNITIEGGTVTASGGSGSYSGAGIGGGHNGAGSDITIEGGTVIATGGAHAAGIGGGYTGAGSSITIENGNVTATGVNGGAGIGGGYDGVGSSITIENGTVTATGGSEAAGIGGGFNAAGSGITIENGTVTATGGSGRICGSGIGGGAYGSGSDITIKNGTVIATGGDGMSVSGAGIGGGAYSTGSSITIENGNVTANGGSKAAGIGGGFNEAGSNITIEGGTVAATGGNNGAGIGSGANGTGSDITIEGGTVTAIGGNNGAGIGGGASGDGSNITIEGGTVIATGYALGAGIGGGTNGTGSDIKISCSADVSAAGGSSYPHNGAAIGDGGSIADDGTEVDINTSELYITGIIKKYQAGTTAAQIANRSVQPIENIVGTVDPELVPVRAISSVITADENYDSTATDPVADSDASFFAAVVMQIDDLLKEINALIAEGRLDEAKALIEKGLAINAGTHQGFNAATLAKLGEASSMGIAVTVNFTYGGAGYSVTIPGNSQIDPAALVDENGYCGFLNLLKYFK